MCKLDPEVKSNWIEALNSDKYSQGVLDLKREHNGETTFCCLGVLLEVQGFYASENITNTGYCEIEQKYLDTETQQQLWQRNDGVGEFSGKRMSFKEIALWIEENL